MSTFVWVAGTALWGDAGAWSPEGTPGLDDTAIFDSSAAVGGNGSAFTLDITSAGGGVTMDGTIEVTVSHLQAPLVILAGGLYQGGTTDSHVLITDDGSLDAILDNTGALAIAGTFSGSFTNEATGGITDDGTYNGSNLDTNLGVLGIGGVFNFDGLTNTNTVSVNGGTLTGNDIINDGSATMSHGHLDLQLFREGATIAAPGSASLDLTNGSIAELEVGFNPSGAGSASSLILNQSTLSVGNAKGGGIYTMQVVDGTLSLTHGSSLIDVSALVSGTLAAGIPVANVVVDGSTWTNTSAFTGLGVGNGTVDFGSVTLTNGGVVSSASIDVGSQSTIVGNGTIDSTSIDLSSGGEITAAGGALLVEGTVTQGTLTIEAAATLEMAGLNDTKSTDFAATSGTLRLDTPHLSFSTIENFGGTDSIVLSGVTVTSEGYSGSPSLGTLTLGLSDTTTAKLMFSGGYTLDSFNIATVGSDTDITFVACFAEGTRIATVGGAVAVEHLAVGDLVLTAAGRDPAPVQWLGHRRVNCARHRRPQDMWPIRVCAGAFEAGVPARDLLLSPDHAVFCDGVLIPVRHLVNGTSIAQIKMAEVTYWHVELPRHEVIRAEDLPCESYLDTGNRGAFANGGAIADLIPDFSSWRREAVSCAPLVVSGPRVEAMRAELLRQVAGPATARRSHAASRSSGPNR